MKAETRSLTGGSLRSFPGIDYGTEGYPPRIARRLRILNVATWMAAAYTGISAFGELISRSPGSIRVGIAYLVSTFFLAAIPVLHRFGPLAGPLAFGIVGYSVIFAICTIVGTDTGMPMQFLVALAIMVFILGGDHPITSAAFAALAAILIVVLELTVPADTGIQSRMHTIVSLIAVVTGSSAILFAIVFYALQETMRAELATQREFERSEALLTNVLPASIAERLKSGRETVIADRYDEASVLFADIAGFTARASEVSAETLVECLNRVFTEFDKLVERHGLEKIKTTGDAYMVVSGVPDPRPDHAKVLANLAIEMRDKALQIPNSQGERTALRIGMACGPVVAGVIGTRKLFFDVWGDTVNVASRMETTCPQGQVHVSSPMHDLLKEDFVFDRLGLIDIKGKGIMETWLLLGPRTSLKRTC